MTGENRAKKDRDPIFMVALVIFLIAAVAVIGISIKDNYFPSGDVAASTGDTVTVEYIGTFYAAYGEEGAVVFDTSYSDIANNGNIAKSEDFTKRSSYSPLSFEVGGNAVLKVFGDSAIGKKVGDKYNIKIDAIDGYSAGAVTGVLAKKGNQMAASLTMTKAEFVASYPDVNLKIGEQTSFETKYGWDGIAMLVEAGKGVNVVYKPTVGSYSVYTNGDTEVKFNVTSVGEKITYDIDILNPVNVPGGIQMIKLDLGDKVVYLTSIESDGIHYKEGSERVNQDLFFEIKIVSIE